MPQTVVIRSLDDLLVHSSQVLLGKASWADVEIPAGSIVLPVVAKGHALDKRVDIRSATLIQKVQKRTDALYSRYTNERELPAPLIKVESKQGSNRLDFDLTAVIRDILAVLPPGDVSMFIALLIGGAMGLGAYG